MLAPSDASGIELDTTTQLCLNNSSRLGYGSITVVNLFATLNDFALREAEAEDPENLKEILLAIRAADHVVYAPGVGKAKNKFFQLRQEQVLKALKPYEVKLCCLCDEDGNARLQHPLSPAVRIWHLSPFKVSELISELLIDDPEPKKKVRQKTAKKDTVQHQEKSCPAPSGQEMKT
jgi:hypothetical protein